MIASAFARRIPNVTANVLAACQQRCPNSSFASSYTPEEQEAALAANLAYAAFCGPYRSPAISNLPEQLVDALATFVVGANIAGASKPRNCVTMAITMPPNGGVRPRMVPDPTTGRMQRLLLDICSEAATDSSHVDENDYAVYSAVSRADSSPRLNRRHACTSSFSNDNVQSFPATMAAT